MGNDADAAVLDAAREQQVTEDARRRAAATPLPSVLADAFLNDAIVVAGIPVRRIVASDWRILQALESPIYKMILEVQKDEAIREDVTYTDEEEWEMCWQFTHNPKECRELMAKGKDEFRRVSTIEMGDMYPMTTTKQIVEAISKQIIRSFDTRLSFGTGDESDKKK